MSKFSYDYNTSSNGDFLPSLDHSVFHYANVLLRKLGYENKRVEYGDENYELVNALEALLDSLAAKDIALAREIEDRCRKLNLEKQLLKDIEKDRGLTT